MSQRLIFQLFGIITLLNISNAAKTLKFVQIYFDEGTIVPMNKYVKDDTEWRGVDRSFVRGDLSRHSKVELSTFTSGITTRYIDNNLLRADEVLYGTVDDSRNSQKIRDLFKVPFFGSVEATNAPVTSLKNCAKRDKLMGLAKSHQEYRDVFENAAFVAHMTAVSNHIGQTVDAENYMNVIIDLNAISMNFPRDQPLEQLLQNSKQFFDQAFKFNLGLFANQMTVNGIDVGDEIRKSWINELFIFNSERLGEVTTGSSIVRDKKLRGYATTATAINSFLMHFRLNNKIDGLPKLGSAIVFELYQENTDYFVKVFHTKLAGTELQFDELTNTISTCNDGYCPYDTLIKTPATAMSGIFSCTVSNHSLYILQTVAPPSASPSNTTAIAIAAVYEKCNCDKENDSSRCIDYCSEDKFFKWHIVIIALITIFVLCVGVCLIVRVIGTEKRNKNVSDPEKKSLTESHEEDVKKADDEQQAFKGGYSTEKSKNDEKYKSALAGIDKSHTRQCNDADMETQKAKNAHTSDFGVLKANRIKSDAELKKLKDDANSKGKRVDKKEAEVMEKSKMVNEKIEMDIAGREQELKDKEREMGLMIAGVKKTADELGASIQASGVAIMRKTVPNPPSEDEAAWKVLIIEAIKLIVDSKMFSPAELLNYQRANHHYVSPTCKTLAFDKNNSKNRYPTIPCQDQHRLILQPPYQDKNDDYINANRVNYSNRNNRFICTQAPLEDTQYSFWAMVVQENVRHIAMLCKCVEQNEEKSVKYWPEKKNESMVFTYKNQKVDDESLQRIKITNIATELLSEEDWAVKATTLMIKCGKASKTRVVKHYQHMYWDEYTVPKTIDTLYYLLANVMQDDRPAVVHCSAGVGRTGAFVAVGLLDDYVRNSKPFDNLLKDLREFRAAAIQDGLQYAFVFYAFIAYYMNDRVIRQAIGAEYVKKYKLWCAKYLVHFEEAKEEREKAENR